MKKGTSTTESPHSTLPSLTVCLLRSAKVEKILTKQAFGIEIDFISCE